MIEETVGNATSLTTVKLQGGNTCTFKSLTQKTTNLNNPTFNDLFTPNIMVFFTMILSLIIAMITLLNDKREQSFMKKLKTPLKSVNGIYTWAQCL